MNSHSPTPPPPVVHSTTGNQSISAVPEPDQNPLLHSRGLILGLLFGVVAILGLPLLWYSPSFNQKEKWFWSIVIILYTLLLVSITVFAITMAYRAMSQF